MESTRDFCGVAQIKAKMKTEIKNATELVMATSVVTVQDMHLSWISQIVAYIDSFDVEFPEASRELLV
jgi:hypothetical protein